MDEYPENSVRRKLGRTAKSTVNGIEGLSKLSDRVVDKPLVGRTIHYAHLQFPGAPLFLNGFCQPVRLPFDLLAPVLPVSR